MIRRLLVFLGIAGIALLLAFPLRDVVYATIIVPVAYVLWLLGIIYRSVNQSLWWGFVSIFVVFLLLRGLLPQTKPTRMHFFPAPKPMGQVETLSLWTKKAERGIYFRWLIANRLSKIASQIISQRETGRHRSVFDPLTGPGWEPNPSVQAYLETGLHGSFTDYPQKNGLFSRPTSTPMDHDVSEVIEYLETQIED